MFNPKTGFSQYRNSINLHNNVSMVVKIDEQVLGGCYLTIKLINDQGVSTDITIFANKDVDVIGGLIPAGNIPLNKEILDADEYIKSITTITKDGE